jgi:predicted kinase
MLIEFGGLPGTGKSTLSREVARRLGAIWLRVDVIEAALVRSGLAKFETIGPAGYTVARDVAESNLALGRIVVVDAVNPVEEARTVWSDLSARCSAPLRVVEVICSDVTRHRQRVESRTPDIDGHVVPSWQDVLDRKYEPWYEPRLTVDTAFEGAADCVRRVLDYAGQRP